MAVRQYIGARYTPRFLGTYDNTTAYEALDVVDNGLGTSYIAKIPTPPGTPLTDTTHWALYGASSGAIINLQNQIDTLNTDLSALDTQVNNDIDALDDKVDKLPIRRKYVLIGDSFGVGVIDASTPWTTGWEDYFHSLFPDDVFYFDPASDPSFPGTGAFTNSTGYNFTNQLEYVYDNLMGTTSPDQITDIVVLGGSNEIGTLNEIIAAIDAFCTRAHTLYKNAAIKLGCVGLIARKLVANNAYPGYSRGAGKNGCEFFSDLLNLGASRTYDSGLGHWTAAGYAIFNPIIAKCIISGHTNYSFTEAITLTTGSDISVPGGVTFTLEIRRTEKGVYGHILNNTNWVGWYVNNNKALSAGQHSVDAFTFTGGFYPAVVSGSGMDISLCVYNNSNNQFDSAACKASLVLDVGGSPSAHKITFATFRRLSYSNYADLSFTWNGSANFRLEGSETY